jgi:hypothetical protein
MKMVMLGLGRPVKIEPLSGLYFHFPCFAAIAEKMAVELGGDILSEFIVFAIASTLLVIEFRRQYASSAAKEAALHVCCSCALKFLYFTGPIGENRRLT